MSKKLVAFFSSSGETKEVAQWIVEATGADCFEIKPAEAYTEADLNYTDPDCRATAEMNDPDCRPELAAKVEDASAYDTVLLGFPIWFYAAPRIVNSFIEQTDLAGKKIAIIGVVTPTTFTQSKIYTIVDDTGQPMYDFMVDETGDKLAECIQKYVDEVQGKGADIVILMAHLGNTKTGDPPVPF
jgi:flavodoxin